MSNEKKIHLGEQPQRATAERSATGSLPGEDAGACELGATSEELQALLRDRLPEFESWIRGQTLGGCPEHGMVLYRYDLDRFFRGREVLD